MALIPTAAVAGAKLGEVPSKCAAAKPLVHNLSIFAQTPHSSDAEADVTQTAMEAKIAATFAKCANASTGNEHWSDEINAAFYQGLSKQYDDSDATAKIIIAGGPKKFSDIAVKQIEFNGLIQTMNR